MFQENFRCLCGWHSQRVDLGYFPHTEEDPERELYLTVSLTNEDRWWKRLWTSILYVCGKLQYTDHEEVILEVSDAIRMRDFLKKFITQIKMKNCEKCGGSGYEDVETFDKKR